MEYRIIERRNQIRLVEAINDLCKKGWKPQGGVSVVRDMTKCLTGEVYLYQAMVKND